MICVILNIYYIYIYLYYMYMYIYKVHVSDDTKPHTLIKEELYRKTLLQVEKFPNLWE